MNLLNPTTFKFPQPIQPSADEQTRNHLRVIEEKGDLLPEQVVALVRAGLIDFLSREDFERLQAERQNLKNLAESLPGLYKELEEKEKQLKSLDSEIEDLEKKEKSFMHRVVTNYRVLAEEAKSLSGKCKFRTELEGEINALQDNINEAGNTNREEGPNLEGYRGSAVGYVRINEAGRRFLTGSSSIPTAMSKPQPEVKPSQAATLTALATFERLNGLLDNEGPEAAHLALLREMKTLPPTELFELCEEIRDSYLDNSRWTEVRSLVIDTANALGDQFSTFLANTLLQAVKDAIDDDDMKELLLEHSEAVGPAIGQVAALLVEESLKDESSTAFGVMILKMWCSKIEPGELKDLLLLAYDEVDADGVDSVAEAAKEAAPHLGEKCGEGLAELVKKFVGDEFLEEAARMLTGLPKTEMRNAAGCAADFVEQALDQDEVKPAEDVLKGYKSVFTAEQLSAAVVKLAEAYSIENWDDFAQLLYGDFYELLGAKAPETIAQIHEDLLDNDCRDEARNLFDSYKEVLGEKQSAIAVAQAAAFEDNEEWDSLDRFVEDNVDALPADELKRILPNLLENVEGDLSDDVIKHAVSTLKDDEDGLKDLFKAIAEHCSNSVNDSLTLVQGQLKPLGGCATTVLDTLIEEEEWLEATDAVHRFCKFMPAKDLAHCGVQVIQNLEEEGDRKEVADVFIRIAPYLGEYSNIVTAEVLPELAESASFKELRRIHDVLGEPLASAVRERVKQEEQSLRDRRCKEERSELLKYFGLDFLK